MNSSTTQIETDITWLQDNCEMTNLQCDEILNACEEFVFICEDEDGNEDVDALHRIHDEDYLRINWGLS